MTRRTALPLALLLPLAALTGCDTTSKTARNAVTLYHVGDYADAEATLKPDISKKTENFVLNNCRFGSCALAAGDLPGAENAFMSAYEVMNGVSTNDGGRTLGATMVFEGVKVWKGEPFERAMAHYYLGLVYLIQHDYENARAAFQNSLFKLREYADKDDPEHYRASESSFALGYLGLGICYDRLGNSDLAAANYKLAERINPSLAPAIADLRKPGVNAILFVDAGMGPRRAPKGWYNEESAFGPTPAEVGPIPPITAFVDGKEATPPGEPFHAVDTLAMAQQQQWQDIDTIRKTKAVIGTGAMAGGAGLTAYGAQKHDTGLALAGVGVMAIGAALAASSQADVRYWEMLPRTVYVIPLSLPPGSHEVLVRTPTNQSAPLTVTIPPATPGAPAPAENVYYFRLR